MSSTWSDTEILFIQDNWDKLSIEEISLKLNRTNSSVYHKGIRLKLVKSSTKKRSKPKKIYTYDSSMEGLKFSNWLVIKFMGKNSSGRDHFECKCICGSIRNVEGQSLIHNKSRSCGCTRRRTKEQIIERKKKYKAEWFQKNKEIIRLRKQGKPTSTEDGRKYNNKYLYNLTEEVYNSMLFNQNGLCKICGTPHIETRIGRLRLDHNHDTGEIRGLLCHNCNLGLGLFKDDKQSLLKAIKYLNGE